MNFLGLTCCLGVLRPIFFFSFVLGLVFYEIRKEKGRNGEDNKDNKMNRKWKRKKEMEKGKGKNDDQKWSVFQVLYKRRAKSTEEPTEFYTKQETALCVCFLFFLINLNTQASHFWGKKRKKKKT